MTERVLGRHGSPRTVDAIDALGAAPPATGAALAASVSARPRQISWRKVYGVTFWGLFVLMVLSMSFGQTRSGFVFGGLFMVMALASKYGS